METPSIVIPVDKTRDFQFAVVPVTGEDPPGGAVASRIIWKPSRSFITKKVTKRHAEEWDFSETFPTFDYAFGVFRAAVKDFLSNVRVTPIARIARSMAMMEARYEGVDPDLAELTWRELLEEEDVIDEDEDKD